MHRLQACPCPLPPPRHRFGGLRIAGLSGIYKSHDYLRGHHEALPYNDKTIRSMYHIRDFEVGRGADREGKSCVAGRNYAVLIASRAYLLHPPAAHLAAPPACPPPSPRAHVPTCPAPARLPLLPQVYRLMQLQQPVDIFLSHDWPTGIARYGNMQQLLARKVGRSDMAQNRPQGP